MVNTYDKAMRILSGSKRYEFEGTVLRVTDYYSNNTFQIDFSNMTPEIFEALRGTVYAQIVYNENEDCYEVWDDEGDEIYDSFPDLEDAIEFCEDNEYEYDIM